MPVTALPVRIIGIDPGSRITGYGVIEKNGHRLGFVTCGTIRTEKEKYFLFSAAGGLIFLCSSVKDPWLENKIQTPFL